MRLKQLALASIFTALVFSPLSALPVLAQTPPAATVAPVKPAAPAVAPSAVAPSTVAPSAMAPGTVAPAAPKATAATTAKPVKPAKVVGPVNVNTATAAELDALPGIGKARAASIIKNRPYKSVDEVDTKKAIPHATFEKIKGSLTL